MTAAGNLRNMSSSTSGSHPTLAFDNGRNNSRDGGLLESWDDATWILTSSFIIFTMQSGFGLLESGLVSSKNEVNIMAKNVADVIFGGISYWMLGYGFSFGDGSGTNGFCGIGKFFIDPDESVMGEEFSNFVFQSSFATTATTIVSGAIAERTRYVAYIVFSFVNTFVFCFPAHWVWSRYGWLNMLGVVDVAGDGPVHLVGGATALIAAILMKPRARRFTPEDDHEMGSPSGALLGLFILWWGWLAFNCGSTYGISGGKWKMAARAAATTLMAASTGGVAGFVGSYLVHKKKFIIPFIINGVLAGLVSITASCAVTGVWESLVIGLVGGVLVLLSDALLARLHVDDPVSAVSVHGVGAVWGLLAAGLFTHKDTVTMQFADRHGLIKGGGFYLLGVQTLAVLVIIVWSMTTAGLTLWVIDLTIGLRLTPEEEELGADLIEHDIRPWKTAKSEIVKPNDVNDNEHEFVNHRSFNATRNAQVLSSAIAELAENSSLHSSDNGLVLRIDSALGKDVANSHKNKHHALHNLWGKRDSDRKKNNKSLRRINVRNGPRKDLPLNSSNELQLTEIHRKNSITNSSSSVCMLSYTSRDDLASMSNDI